MNKDALLDLHGRLLDGDPTASAEIAELVLGPLTEGFKRAFPRVEETLITDAVEDAILSYLKMPSRRSLCLQEGLHGDLASSAWTDSIKKS